MHLKLLAKTNTMENMLDNPESKLLKEKNIKKVTNLKEMKNIQNENRKKTILIIFVFNRKKLHDNIPY